MKFDDGDFIETFDGRFWLVVRVNNADDELEVMSWTGNESIDITFDDVMNRWVEKPL